MARATVSHLGVRRAAQGPDRSTLGERPDDAGVLTDLPAIPTGALVRAARRRDGRPQAAVAGLCGISTDYLSQIERSRKKPSGTCWPSSPPNSASRSGRCWATMTPHRPRPSRP
ncbi:helix-turn-helix domain-containing protein [Streptomyces anulatus]|uniref:helix-turn-helix domain-containing protein n=1 Tax=Streptomyces anulatus TaxID=1892 RepID=UPI00368EFA66